MSDGNYPIEHDVIDAEELGNLRLLRAAQAVRQSPAPDMFTMVMLARPCGTPACVLGCYAAAPDTPFRLEENGMLIMEGRQVGFLSAGVKEHFAITDYQAEMLFAVDGCDDAQSPEEAASFVERFVARRRERAKAREKRARCRERPARGKLVERKP